MEHLDAHFGQLRHLLAAESSPKVALSAQRYFPHPVNILGVANGEVMKIADDYLKVHVDLSPADRLNLTERLIAEGEYHEELMLGFALIRKVVKRNFDDELLSRFHYWLEHHISNWAQCDDLCLKVIYPYFLSRTPLITRIGSWTDSPAIWCRRAGNVALVKFIHRKIGKELYRLPLQIVFDNSLKLFDDPEPYVQKSVGWLLKASAKVHQDEVVGFIEKNVGRMQRGTLRYAIEHLVPEQRRALMAMKG